jgi:hypothetical protein
MAAVAFFPARGRCRVVRYNSDEPTNQETEKPEVTMHAVIRGMLMLVVAAVAVLVPVGGDAQPNPDLSGKWTLDKEKSDDAEAVIRAGLGVTEKTTGRPDVKALQVADRLVALSRALESLEIRQSEKDFRIYDDANNVRIYYIDDKKHARETPWGAKLETVTGWNNGALHMRTEGDELGKVDETYGLEGRQMVFIVRIRVKDAQEDVVVRSYYSRAEK